MDSEQQGVNNKNSAVKLLTIEFAVIFFVIAIPYFFYGLYKDNYVDEDKRVLNRLKSVQGKGCVHTTNLPPPLIDRKRQRQQKKTKNGR